MDKITLNSKEYVDMQSYNDLELEFKAYKEKEVSTLSKQYILDPANVLAMGFIINEEEPILRVNGLNLLFKPLDKDFDEVITFNGSLEKFYLSDGSCYSGSYLKRIKKICYDWGGYKNLRVSQACDKEGKVKKDNPILLSAGKLAFVLAPRIENL